MSAVETQRKSHTDTEHVCSPRHVHWFDNLLRPLVHNTNKLFSPYVKPGMTVMDVGCGKGFASLGLARLVGETGRVIAADLQAEMLMMVKERAEKAGLTDRIHLHRCQADRVGAEEGLDFILAFWMAHETPDIDAFLREMHALLKPGGHFYLIEPKMHVDKKEFARVLERLEGIGFSVVDKPKVRFSQAAVFMKGDRSQGPGVSE